MNVLKFYFYRHGATKGNEERRYVGRTDEDITKNSEEYLKTIETVDADVVFSSPLKRCVHTAEILFPENKIIIKNRIEETDFGDFEYKNYEELKENKDYQSWLDSGGKSGFPNGEGYLEFKERCITAFEEIKEECLKNNYKKVAVVSHGGVIMAIFEKFAEGNFYDYQIKNGECISAFYNADENKFYEIKRIKYD